MGRKNKKKKYYDEPLSKEMVSNIINEAVEKQIKEKDPPEVARTYYRLIVMGLSSKEAKSQIIRAFSIEIGRDKDSDYAWEKESYIEILKMLPLEDEEFNDLYLSFKN